MIAPDAGQQTALGHMPPDGAGQLFLSWKETKNSVDGYSLVVQ